MPTAKSQQHSFSTHVAELCCTGLRTECCSDCQFTFSPDISLLVLWGPAGDCWLLQHEVMTLGYKGEGEA